MTLWLEQLFSTKMKDLWSDAREIARKISCPHTTLPWSPTTCIHWVCSSLVVQCLSWEETDGLGPSEVKQLQQSKWQVTDKSQDWENTEMRQDSSVYSNKNKGLWKWPHTCMHMHPYSHACTHTHTHAYIIHTCMLNMQKIYTHTKYPKNSSW